MRQVIIRIVGLNACVLCCVYGVKVGNLLYGTRHACAFLCEPQASDLQASPQPRVNFTSYGRVQNCPSAAGACFFQLLHVFQKMLFFGGAQK